ncbi:hypothetical protein I4U23_031032 [Adineta vaga]|nr:hypothetical protein I4U23_031032 [Adineta vaga]
MLRVLFFIFVSFLVYIPHTSIQDVAKPWKDHHRSRRDAQPPVNDSRNKLIMALTEHQHQYETAFYALALDKTFPNFAQLFHERSEQKYNVIKGLIRLFQLLGLETNLVNVQLSSSNGPLKLVAFDKRNQMNFIDYFSQVEYDECTTTFKYLKEVYEEKNSASEPLQMYLKKKVYPKQRLLCKQTSDLHVQLGRLQDSTINGSNIPFSFIYADSRAKYLLSE